MLRNLWLRKNDFEFELTYYQYTFCAKLYVNWDLKLLYYVFSFESYFNYFPLIFYFKVYFDKPNKSDVWTIYYHYARKHTKVDPKVFIFKPVDYVYQLLTY